ncbi:SURF1 family protein [Sandarakinorhabdus rubra]|uniref:SURF1 family protein n=1 Tax=Sandarakinorhabdus rubra TaxID=2672568 RepID=UPI0013DD72A0|nr:SURF1 family cytochrome oxidase biogenesis protein [Sandarakinorhabdus rubra]
MSRRIPLIPTLITVIGVLVLCGLGRWQLERREWKRDLIARLEAAGTLPPVSPSEFARAMQGTLSVQYRRAEIGCHAGPKRPYDLRPGSSAGGTSGFYVVVSCRPNDLPPDIVAVAGWTRRADARDKVLNLDHELAGVVIENPYGKEPGRPRFMLIPDSAIAPLGRPRQPRAADLPDNHLAYAGQWFGLAVALAFIYGLWLRRRGMVAPPARPQ